MATTTTINDAALTISANAYGEPLLLLSAADCGGYHDVSIPAPGKGQARKLFGTLQEALLSIVDAHPVIYRNSTIEGPCAVIYIEQKSANREYHVPCFTAERAKQLVRALNHIRQMELQVAEAALKPVNPRRRKAVKGKRPKRVSAAAAARRVAEADRKAAAKRKAA